MQKQIEINGLRLYCRHGVMAQEKAVGNWFEVDIRMDIPFGENDNLEETVNYADVIEATREVMSRPEKLIETAAAQLRDTLTERFPLIEGGRVRVAKLMPPVSGVELGSVAAVIEWE